jgi:hypothetical protein
MYVVLQAAAKMPGEQYPAESERLGGLAVECKAVLSNGLKRKPDPKQDPT